MNIRGEKISEIVYNYSYPENPVIPEKPPGTVISVDQDGPPKSEK